MPTLDSLSRSDLLTTLQKMVKEHEIIENNNNVMRKTKYQIEDLHRDYQYRLKAANSSFIRSFGIYLLFGSLVYIPGLLKLIFTVLPGEGESPHFLLYILIALVPACIIVPILMVLSGNKACKRKKADLESLILPIYKADVAQREQIIENGKKYNSAAQKRLGALYASYSVRGEMQDYYALDYCYKEIKSSATTTVNQAFQNYLTQKARQEAAADRAAANRLQEEHNREVAKLRPEIQRGNAAMERAADELRWQNYHRR